MDSLTDEIEAVLFVAREVMGEYACLLCGQGNQRLRYRQSTRFLRERPQPGIKPLNGMSSPSYGRDG